MPIHQVRESSVGHRPPIGMCQWTVECLADADTVRIEPPPGRTVPRHLARALAQARRIIASEPSTIATIVVEKLLCDVADWLEAPVEVTQRSNTIDLGDTDIVISEVVIGMAED